MYQNNSIISLKLKNPGGSHAPPPHTNVAPPLDVIIGNNVEQQRVFYYINGIIN
jgi:hypothetical protein